MSSSPSDGPQALQTAFVAALAANDADAIAACYAEGSVSYPMDEMAGIGPGFVRDSWQHFFNVYSIIDVRLVDTSMESLGETAVSWGLFRMLVQTVDGGEEIELHGRFTDVAKLVRGRWLYVADHASVPLPPE